MQNEKSRTSLHWLISRRQSRFVSRGDAIRMIINNGGNPSITNNLGENALLFALRYGADVDEIRAILEGQPKPSPLVTAKNKNGATPMLYLAMQNELLKPEILKVLVDFVGDINEKNKNGKTLLHIVFAHCRYSGEWWNFKAIAESFVELGADVNAKNKSKHMVLRRPIDLPIALDLVTALIPTKEVLNDESCWNGPFLEYVLKNSPFKGGCELLKAAMEAGVIVSNKTLLIAIEHDDIESKHVELLLSRGCLVKIEVFEKVLRHIRFDLLEPILMAADDEMSMLMKIRHPDIFLTLSRGFMDVENVPLVKLISMFATKFEIDINYKSEDEKSTLLHNLVYYLQETEDQTILDSVLAMDNLDIQLTIKVNVYGHEFPAKNMSALDYAIYIGNYKAAEILIRNFAEHENLFLDSIQEGFVHSFVLLSVLGHQFDFEKMKKLESATDVILQEIEYVENWIRERTKTVLSLKELAALEVRQQSSKHYLIRLVAELEIPVDVQDILFLKCYKSDFVAKKGYKSDEMPDPECVIYLSN